MATLKEFEELLRERGMLTALAILDELKKRDRAKRSIAPARRVVGRKMTADLARTILDLHATTAMTQQEIAFKLSVNQGRVNEVIKRGKWLSGDPSAPEIMSRDRAMQRLDQRSRSRRLPAPPPVAAPPSPVRAKSRAVDPLPSPKPVVTVLKARPLAPRAVLPTPQPKIVSAQLAFLDL